MYPLIYDFMGKSFFFKEERFLRMFLNSQLKGEVDIDFEYESNKIRFINTEMTKDNKKEKKKILDILLVVNDNIFIDLELNTQRFKDVIERNWLYILKVTVSVIGDGEKVKAKDIIQLNLNSNKSEKNIPNYSMNIFDKDYPEYLKNSIGDYKIIVKNIAYYEYLYYNKHEKLSKEHMWLLVINARSYVKLYKLLCEILDNEEDIDRFMERMIKLMGDDFILTEAEVKVLDEIERNATIRNSKEDGKKEKGIEVAKNMLKDKVNLETISKYTGLSKKEIKKL